MASKTEIVSSGVDWITCSGNTKTSRRKVFNLGMRLLDQEIKRGNFKRAWGMEGYKGWKAGGIQVGARPDSGILRITGGLADDHYLEAFHACDNVSRCDWQVTVRTDRPPQKVIASEYKRAFRKSNSGPRMPQCYIHRNSNGTATLYLSTRRSDRSMRIYDKGFESVLPVLDGCVRYEAQLNNEVALRWTADLVKQRFPRPHIAACLRQFARLRGCRPSFATDCAKLISLPRTATDHARSLRWLRDGVRPRVQLLLAAGLLREVEDCLGLRTEFVKSRSLRKVS